MRTKQSKHNTESEKEEQHESHQTTAVKPGARKTVKLLLYMFTLRKAVPYRLYKHTLELELEVS